MKDRLKRIGVLLLGICVISTNILPASAVQLQQNESQIQEVTELESEVSVETETIQEVVEETEVQELTPEEDGLQREAEIKQIQSSLDNIEQVEANQERYGQFIEVTEDENGTKTTMDEESLQAMLKSLKMKRVTGVNANREVLKALGYTNAELDNMGQEEIDIIVTEAKSLEVTESYLRVGEDGNQEVITEEQCIDGLKEMESLAQSLEEIGQIGNPSVAEDGYMRMVISINYLGIQEQDTNLESYDISTTYSWLKSPMATFLDGISISTTSNMFWSKDIEDYYCVGSSIRHYKSNGESTFNREDFEVKRAGASEINGISSIVPVPARIFGPYGDTVSYSSDIVFYLKGRVRALEETKMFEARAKYLHTYVGLGVELGFSWGTDGNGVAGISVFPEIASTSYYAFADGDFTQEKEIGSSREAIPVVLEDGVSQTVHGYAPEVKMFQWYKITIPTRGSLELRFASTSSTTLPFSNSNVIVQKVSGENILVWSSYLDNGKVYSNTCYNLEAGDYYALIKDVNPGMFSATFTFSNTELNPNTKEGAEVIDLSKGGSQLCMGTIKAGEKNWYKIKIPKYRGEIGAVLISTDGIPLANNKFALRMAKGSTGSILPEVGFTDVTGLVINHIKHYTQIDLLKPRESEFYVYVDNIHKDAKNGIYNIVFSYSLEDKEGDTKEEAKLLKIGKEYEVGTEYRNDSDWYKVKIPYRGTAKMCFIFEEGQEGFFKQALMIKSSDGVRNWLQGIMPKGIHRTGIMNPEEDDGFIYFHIDSGNMTGKYRIIVEYTDEDREGNTISTAVDMGDMVAYQGITEYSTDTDYFSKYLLKGDHYLYTTITPDVERKSLNGVMASILLYDSNGRNLSRSWNASRGAYRINIPENGYYYVKVYGGEKLSYTFAFDLLIPDL
jgi:hypothetical protein